MSNPKPKVVAFAYDNPVFDTERLAGRTRKNEESPERTANVEIGLGPPEKQQDPEEVSISYIYVPMQYSLHHAPCVPLNAL